MEIILDSKEQTTYRFQSGCYEPSCAIDVEVGKRVAPGHRFIQIQFWATPDSWRNRIRWCWKMLWYGMGYDHEFFLQEEDINDFVKVIRG